MMDNISKILQQALTEERKLRISELKNVSKMQHSKILERLLPNYDMDIHDGKPRRWHDAKQTEKLIKGGVRSGKTTILCARAILLSYLNRPYLHTSISPSFNNAEMTVVRVLEELCEKNSLEYEWLISKQLFRIIHGQSKKDIATIYVVGADQKYKGLTSASGDANEAFSIPKKKIDVWYERISLKVNCLERIYGSTAEPDSMDWGFDLFDKELIDTPELYADTIYTEDNTYLPPEYIEKIRSRYDTKMQKVYMYGGYINLTAGKTYHSFDIERNKKPLEKMMELIEKRSTIEIVLGFDFNVDPMTCTEWILLANKRVQVDEYKVHSSNTDEICTLVINRMIDKYPGIAAPTPEYRNEKRRNGKVGKYSLVITGDASGRARKTSSFGKTDFLIIKARFEQAGFKFTMAVSKENPPVRDRVNYVNKLFETEEAVICDNCENSIKDRQLVSWKQGAEGFHLDKSKKDRTHLSEAGDYALWITQRMIRSKEDADKLYRT